MKSFDLKVDPREQFYARFASNILGALRTAVGTRVSEGMSQQEIAEKIGCHKSSISRTLNGRVNNVTIKTVSDILWACSAEPRQFEFDFLEDLQANFIPDHKCRKIHEFSENYSVFGEEFRPKTESLDQYIYWIKPAQEGRQL